MEITHYLNKVNDKESFLVFAKALLQDAENNSKDWENFTIPAFLEASISWAEDSEFGMDQDLNDGNPWKSFAVFLCAGKIYE